MKGEVRIGTSGWNYADWAGGTFYPPGLKPAQWLPHYAKHFDTVEVNNTFYHLPDQHVFEQWRDKTPATFSFALKASRFFTHIKKLAEPEEHLARFLEHARGLKEKLGVVLFQLPPSLQFNEGRLAALCGWWQQQRIMPGVRAALEVRHPSWLGEAGLEILRQHNLALVLSDWPRLTVAGPLTADFVFVRRHGPEQLYASNYPDAVLRADARWIRSWRAAGRSVYAYFNNDVSGFAVQNAQTLKAFVE